MRPLLLDLFAGAGGCAVGYHRAGFEVVGLDVERQPRYPFAFVRGDALRPPFDLRDFAVIAASPPCQAYSRATAWRGDREKHPDLIAAVRAMLAASGRPYVIETVQEGRRRLHHPIMLCGSMFGLRVQRHRYFEAPSLPLVLTPDCRHSKDDFSFDHGGKQPESAYRDAMGCEWMTVHDAREAIPPAYTEYLGKLLLTTVSRTGVTS
jgi:C-5 cytosine-specific DNA methylase